MHNKALIGIIIITLLFAANVAYIGYKNLWFEPKNRYWTLLKTADGLREGTLVTFHGLKMGEVTELAVTERNFIKVNFYVRKSMAKKITIGSLVRVSRSMMIGEKKLEIIPGPVVNALVPNHSFIRGQDVREISDLLTSGEQLQRFVPQLERILNNVDMIMGSVAENPDMIPKVIKILDEANVLMKTVERSWLFKGSYKNFINEQKNKAEAK
ncbi:MAG: MCE family protein [Spirochaetes bacterium]|nr:MCE family protein [Spirochaetota bacterium]